MILNKNENVILKSNRFRMKWPHQVFPIKNWMHINWVDDLIILSFSFFFPLILLPSESYFDVYSRPIVEFKLNETRNETITYDDKRRTIPPWRIALRPINLIRALYRASIPSNPTSFIVRHIGRVVTFFYEEEESHRIIPFAIKSLLLICPKNGQTNIEYSTS